MAWRARAATDSRRVRRKRCKSCAENLSARANAGTTARGEDGGTRWQPVGHRRRHRRARGKARDINGITLQLHGDDRAGNNLVISHATNDTLVIPSPSRIPVLGDGTMGRLCLILLALRGARRGQEPARGSG